MEPLEFNRLLDEISSLEGVAYCLCPGSGGYDAIFILALPDPSAQPLEPLIL